MSVIFINPYSFGAVAYDADAQAYITAVETTDGQALETGVRDAINAFVVGCKADGIWTAIKACCILAGARTRLGALTPLVGAAPTSFNFVDADYNRKTGLVGNGSSKYLDSNASVLSTGIGQDNHSFSVYVSSLGGGGLIDLGRGLTGAIGIHGNLPNFTIRSASSSFTARSAAEGFSALGRSSSSVFTSRVASVNQSHSLISQSLRTGTVALYRFSEGSQLYSTARLAFYSIGKSLTLALLDARVTTLINAYAAAIP